MASTPSPAGAHRRPKAHWARRGTAVRSAGHRIERGQRRLSGCACSGSNRSIARWGALRRGRPRRRRRLKRGRSRARAPISWIDAQTLQRGFRGCLSLSTGHAAGPPRRFSVRSVFSEQIVRTSSRGQHDRAARALRRACTPRCSTLPPSADIRRSGPAEPVDPANPPRANAALRSAKPPRPMANLRHRRTEPGPWRRSRRR